MSAMNAMSTMLNIVECYELVKLWVEYCEYSNDNAYYHSCDSYDPINRKTLNESSSEFPCSCAAFHFKEMPENRQQSSQTMPDCGSGLQAVGGGGGAPETQKPKHSSPAALVLREVTPWDP